MAFTFTIDENDLDLIFIGLRKLPMENVEMLVYKLRVQQVHQKQAEEIATSNEDAVAENADDSAKDNFV